MTKETTVPPIIHATGIKKSFKVGDRKIEVLHGMDFSINSGDFVIIFGPSGSGKSTLLHIMLGLEAPTEGVIEFFGENLYEKSSSEDKRSVYRKQLVGMIYQQPNWIRALNVIENVSFPLILLGVDEENRKRMATRALEQVGMADWAYYRPTELSSGQQQKIALARGLVNTPEVIIADEPTGNLDYKSGVELMDLLLDLNKNGGRTIIMVTHDLEYIKYASVVLRIFDGTIAGVYHEEDKAKLLDELQLKRGVL